MNTDNLIWLAIKNAVTAGDEIIKIFNTKIKISIKRNLTPVTNADKIANEIICKGLLPLNFPVISEETRQLSYEERKQWEYCWIIDPLDGTKEFIARRKDFTVNIAFIIKNQPVLGVIYAPAHDVLYFGSDSLGSYKTEFVKNHLAQSKDIKDIIGKSIKLPFTTTTKYTYVVSRSHMSSATKSYLKTQKTDKELISRGSSLKLCAIAEGSADEYPRFGKTMEWDIAAGDAIIRNSGGKILQINSGENLSYNKENLGNPEFIAYRL